MIRCCGISYNFTCKLATNKKISVNYHISYYAFVVVVKLLSILFKNRQMKIKNCGKLIVLLIVKSGLHPETFPLLSFSS